MINKKNFLLLCILTIVIINIIPTVFANDLNHANIQANTQETNLEKNSLEEINLEETINEEVPLEKTRVEEINLEETINEEVPLEKTRVEESASDTSYDDIETNEKVLSETPKSFSELNSLINDNSNTTITLNDDYTFNEETDGDFLKGIPITHTIVLDGNNHTINGLSIAKGFNVSAVDVVFKNLKFYNLGVKESNTINNGGAIYSPTEAYNTLIIDSEFYNCKGYVGGALHCADVQNCYFLNVSAYYNGGAIYKGSAQNSSFINCQASGSGGAIYNSSKPIINCNFTNNRGGQWGGAVYGVLSCINCNFTGNNILTTAPTTYSRGGAAYNTHLVNCYFENNFAVFYGGAVYHYYKYDIINCTFINNTADYGGAVYTGVNNVHSNLIDCKFINNTGRLDGNAVYGGNSILCQYINNGSENSSFISANLITEDINVTYPLEVNMPLKLAYNSTNFGEYVFEDVNISIDLYKEGGNIGKYYALTGSSWNIALEPGNYIAKFSYASPYNNQYTLNATDTNINVALMKAQFDVEDEVTAIYGEGKLNVKLTNEFGEKMCFCDVNLCVGTINQTLKTNENGTVEFDISELVGKHIATLKFEGNNMVQFTKKDFYITITKLATQIISNNPTFIYGENGTLKATLTLINGTPLKDLDLRIIIESINETLKTNENGEITLDLSNKLTIGSYNGEIFFDGFEKYENSNTSLRFSVKKVPTELICSDIICTYDDGANLIATLKDKYENIIKNARICLKVSDLTFSEISDSNGQARFPISKLSTGTHQTSIIFEGDDLYDLSSENLIITVNKIVTKISAPSVSTSYDIAKNLVITLKDGRNNPIANAKITINLNGKNKVLTTDGSGQAKISSYNLVPNTYTVKISFNGIDNYLPSTYSTKIIIKRAKLKLIAKNKTFKRKIKVKKYAVYVKSNKGKAIKNIKISLKIKGKSYIAKTNKKGVATFKIKNLKKKGKFKAFIKFAGNKYYKHLNKKARITVK